MKYPITPKIPVEDKYGKVIVIDDYRWLEDGSDPRVQAWQQKQNKLTRAVLDKSTQRLPLIKRLIELMRYDLWGIPMQVQESERIFQTLKQKDKEKQLYFYRDSEDSDPKLLLDPNQWAEDESVYDFVPSRDGKLVAFSRIKGGDEKAVVYIMKVDTGEILPDQLQGWKQSSICWLPDSSGFYYSAKPLKGSVPPGEEQYWHSIYFHRLGTPREQDEKIFFSTTRKEDFHIAQMSEDGSIIFFYRTQFYRNEVYYLRVGEKGAPKPLITYFDADYAVDYFDGRLFIYTDWEAPLKRVCVTTLDHPEREAWQDFIPESRDKLAWFTYIGGHFYTIHEHDAYSVITAYDGDGKYLHDVPLPTMGSAFISGLWAHPQVWVSFQSYVYPTARYKYDVNSNQLNLFNKYPVEVDTDRYVTEQVFYKSKDRTTVPMFIVHARDVKKDNSNPTLLTGYGGFNASMSPYFNGLYIAWLEAGGMVAVANLRGGGEYGKSWHEAGMLENKQNVFDDFIAAAEWLISSGYTSPAHLAIEGGSNGGLLVGAVTVQRPDLFRAVSCIMPLLDMLRYQKFDFGSIWTEEYGSSDDPAQFGYLYKYSPYHNVVDGADYPAILLAASDNDNRCDPLHVRKMAARMQAANPNGKPIYLMMWKATGHVGSATITENIERYADEFSFLMDELGMKYPN